MFFLRVLVFLFVVIFSVVSCGKGSEKGAGGGSVDAKLGQKAVEEGVEEGKRRLKETKKLGKAFVAGLQKELKGAIKARGIAEAIAVCKEASATYEKEFKGKDADIVSFRRISLKARNLDSHTPTDSERDWLMGVEKGMGSGSKPGPGILRKEGKLTVLLPIVIEKDVCLKCHGDSSKFSKGLKDALNKNYPLDKAIGYKMHDLRGALAVEWKSD